jgi:hypothetical protein
MLTVVCNFLLVSRRHEHGRRESLEVNRHSWLRSDREDDIARLLARLDVLGRLDDLAE